MFLKITNVFLLLAAEDTFNSLEQDNVFLAKFKDAKNALLMMPNLAQLAELLIYLSTEIDVFVATALLDSSKLQLLELVLLAQPTATNAKMPLTALLAKITTSYTKEDADLTALADIPNLTENAFLAILRIVPPVLLMEKLASNVINLCS